MGKFVSYGSIVLSLIDGGSLSLFILITLCCQCATFSTDCNVLKMCGVSICNKMGVYWNMCLCKPTDEVLIYVGMDHGGRILLDLVIELIKLRLCVCTWQSL